MSTSDSVSYPEMASHTHSLSDHTHNINTLNPELASHTHQGSYTSDIMYTCSQCLRCVNGIIHTFGGLSYCTSCYPVWTNTGSGETITFTLPSAHSDKEVKDLKDQLKSAEERVKWYKDNLADNISWYEDQAKNQDKLIAKLEECLRTPEPVSDDLIKEGQWVTDVSQGKGPYWTIRETLVDIESNKRAHRVPGWVLVDKNGKYYELPTVVLAKDNPCSYKVKRNALPSIMDAAISIPLVGISLYYLMTLIYNVI